MKGLLQNTKCRRIASVMLACMMVIGSLFVALQKAYAATITSMSYYSENDGPVVYHWTYKLDEISAEEANGNVASY